MVKCDQNKHLSAKVFKTVVDPFIGKYSLIKVVTGTLKAGDGIYNVNKGTEDRASKLYLLRGKETIEVPELRAGDIGALAKIEKISTGDTISTKGATLIYDGPQVSKPYTCKAYRAKNKSDEDKINGALARMVEEDQTLRLENDVENHQTLIYGIGDQQLDVVASRILNRYKVEIELYRPKVAYRETLRKKVQVQGKYKKQTGGSGQYGDVHMVFEPSGDLDTPYVFEEKVVGGAVPKNYFPAVEKGIQESVLKGTLAGYPVVGLKATLVDGSYHPVDSSELAFKMAAILAYKKGFAEANPTILEPIVSVSITVPDELVGDVMGDLNKRRGRVLGMDHVAGGKQMVTADVPMAEMYGYSSGTTGPSGVPHGANAVRVHKLHGHEVIHSCAGPHIGGVDNFRAADGIGIYRHNDIAAARELDGYGTHILQTGISAGQSQNAGGWGILRGGLGHIQFGAHPVSLISNEVNTVHFYCAA